MPSCRFHIGGRAFLGTVLEHEFLPAEFMDAWSANFTTVLTHLKVHAASLLWPEEFPSRARTCMCDAACRLQPGKLTQASTSLTPQESVPADTLLVYHTVHVPHRTADASMWEADAFLAQHVAQLNAAGREVRVLLPRLLRSVGEG